MIDTNDRATFWRSISEDAVRAVVLERNTRRFLVDAISDAVDELQNGRVEDAIQILLNALAGETP